MWEIDWLEDVGRSCNLFFSGFKWFLIGLFELYILCLFIVGLFLGRECFGEGKLICWGRGCFFLWCIVGNLLLCSDIVELVNLFFMLIFGYIIIKVMFVLSLLVFCLFYLIVKYRDENVIFFYKIKLEE